MEILDKVSKRSKAALRVQEAPTRKMIETFIEQQETRAVAKDQEAKQLQVEAYSSRKDARGANAHTNNVG